MRVGKQNGHTMYLAAFFSSLSREDEPAARAGAINQSAAESETYYDCNEIRPHEPGKIVTIPSKCDEDLFSKRSNHLLFIGKVEGMLAYLKYVPKPNVNLRFDGTDF